MQYDVGANALGRLNKMTDESGNTTWSYDSHGRVAAKTQTIGSLSKALQHSYDAAGQLSTLTYPSGKAIGYSYDGSGHINRITVNGVTLLSNIQYHPFGSPKSWTFGNNATVSRSFDQDGRLASQNFASITRSLGYDPASRNTALTHAGKPAANQSFNYDALDRITGFTASNTTQAYSYDPTGNRTGITIGATNHPYTNSATSNRLNSVSGPTAKTYSYDASGNLTAGGGYTFTYNDEAASPTPRTARTSRSTRSTVSASGSRKPRKACSQRCCRY